MQFTDNIARDEEEPAKETKEGQPGRKRREKPRKGAGRQGKKFQREGSNHPIMCC